MLQEAHEIPVPEFVLRGRILIVGACSEQQLAHALRWDDLEINTPQGLDEAVLDGVAVVHSRIGLGETSDQQTLACKTQSFINNNLKTEKNRLSLLTLFHRF